MGLSLLHPSTFTTEPFHPSKLLRFDFSHPLRKQRSKLNHLDRAAQWSIKFLIVSTQREPLETIDRRRHCFRCPSQKRLSSPEIQEVQKKKLKIGVRYETVRGNFQRPFSEVFRLKSSRKEFIVASGVSNNAGYNGDTIVDCTTFFLLYSACDYNCRLTSLLTVYYRVNGFSGIS